MTGFSIYTLKDANDGILYIGLTQNLQVRVEQHRRRQPWGDQIASVDAVEVADRREAHALEGELQTIHHPTFATWPTSRRRGEFDYRAPVKRARFTDLDPLVEGRLLTIVSDLYDETESYWRTALALRDRWGLTVPLATLRHWLIRSDRKVAA